MKLYNILQDSAQSSEHLFTISGRKLNLGTYAVYIIRWKFQVDVTPTIDNTFNYKIPITSSIDEIISCRKYLYPNESTIYLGHISQPDNNQYASFNILINNANTFARREMSTSISRQQLTMANNSIIHSHHRNKFTSIEILWIDDCTTIFNWI